MVASFTRFYSLARRHGMAPPAAADRRLLRRWLRRVLAGYWTHAGYLNWDTGLGFRRWHQAKKLGLSQHGLIGIASAPALAGPKTRAWAKWILDQGFGFYERQSTDGAAARRVLRRVGQAAEHRQPVAGRRPRRGQRGPRGRRRARPAPARSRRRCSPSTPTPVAWRSRRPPTTPRSCPSTSAPSPTAASSWRGSTTGARRSRPGSAGGRPPRSASSCAIAPAAACWRRSSRGGDLRRRVAAAA